jgi:hypothetical protein
MHPADQPRLRRFAARVEAALTAPPFDPRTQGWGAAALAAAEVIIGAVLSLFFIAALISRGPHHRVSTAEAAALLAFLGALSGCLLWAGASLMFGSSRRRWAQAVLACVVLAGVAFVALAPAQRV